MLHIACFRASWLPIYLSITKFMGINWMTSKWPVLISSYMAFDNLCSTYTLQDRKFCQGLQGGLILHTCRMKYYHTINATTVLLSVWLLHLVDIAHKLSSLMIIDGRWFIKNLNWPCIALYTSPSFMVLYCHYHAWPINISICFIGSYKHNEVWWWALFKAGWFQMLMSST